MLADSQLAVLTMLCGFDEDFAGQGTQMSNRIQGLLAKINPAMLGPLERYPSPAQLAALTQKQLANWLVKSPRMGISWAAEIRPECAVK